MAVSGISLIQKLQRLFGARAVSDMMGRTTNVQTLAQGTNNPFARTFSKKYLAKNKDGVEEASRVILENMQYAFGNKNIKQMKNFEANVNTLYNLKFPPKPIEAKVVNIGTKKQVTGEGLESLKDDLGIPEDIPPTSPLGESITKAKRKDKVIDPEDKAQGGRAGFKTGGITKLLNLLQGKFGKKAITTADKIDRPESALNRDMFKEFNERVARKTLNVPETPSGFKLSRERLLKNYPEIDEDFANQIMAMDRDMQIRIIEMIKDRRKNPKAYDKLLMEKGDTLDFQGEFDRSVRRSKNAQGGVAGQLHLNEGGRVGLQEGGLPTVESLGGTGPNTEGGSIVYDLGNGEYIYQSSLGFEIVRDGVYTSLGSGYANLQDLLNSGTVLRNPNDPIRIAEEAESARRMSELTKQQAAPTIAAPTIAAPTTAAPTTAAPTTAAPTPTGIQTIPTDKKTFNVMMDEKGNVADDQGMAELARETGMAPGITNLPINNMSDVMRIIGPGDGISEGTGYNMPPPSVEQRMQAASAKGLDARMGRTYAENKQLMADPRMLQASGGRVGLKKGGPPNPGRRNFMKLMAGLASIPVLGKFFKFAKPASKIVQLKNTSTAMPTWFPKFVDKFVNNSVGTKIDADLMEFKNSDLPNIKITRHDDGRVYVEGNNEYNEGYQIEYKPPGYEVVDEKTGKAVKTPGNFDAVEGRHVALSPEDYDTDPFFVDDLDELTTIDVAEMEKYTTGKVTKTVKDAFGQNTGLKKGPRDYEMAVGKAENQADVLKDADLLDEDFASGGRVGLLSGGGVLKAMLKNLGKERGMSGSEMLSVINYKSLPSKIKNLMSQKQFEHYKKIRLKQAKNFRDMMKTKIDFEKSIKAGKAVDERNIGLADLFDYMAENFSKKSAVPRNITEKDLLQMEQMIKNMEMKGRKPNAAGGLAGQLKL